MNVPYAQDELEFIAEQLWKDNHFDKTHFDFIALIEKLNGHIIYVHSQMANNAPYISEVQNGYEVFLNENHRNSTFYNLELCSIIAELFFKNNYKKSPNKIEIDVLGKYILCPYFVYKQMESEDSFSLVEELVKKLHLSQAEIEIVLKNYQDSAMFEPMSKDYLNSIIRAIDSFVPDIKNKSLVDVIFAFDGGINIDINLPINYLFRKTEDGFEITISGLYSSNEVKNQYIAEAFAYFFLGEISTKKERLAFAEELLALLS